MWVNDHLSKTLVTRVDSNQIHNRLELWSCSNPVPTLCNCSSEVIPCRTHNSRISTFHRIPNASKNPSFCLHSSFRIGDRYWKWGQSIRSLRSNSWPHLTFFVTQPEDKTKVTGATRLTSTDLNSIFTIIIFVFKRFSTVFPEATFVNSVCRLIYSYSFFAVFIAHTDILHSVLRSGMEVPRALNPIDEVVLPYFT